MEYKRILLLALGLGLALSTEYSLMADGRGGKRGESRQGEQSREGRGYKGGKRQGRGLRSYHRANAPQEKGGKQGWRGKKGQGEWRGARSGAAIPSKPVVKPAK